MRKFPLFLLFVLGGGLVACNKNAVPARSLTVDTYREDVAPLRPVYTPQPYADQPVAVTTPEGKLPVAKAPTRHITSKLGVVLDSIAVRNRNIKQAMGFRVQVFQGNSREEATKVRERAYAVFANETPYISYEQPYYRVRVGNFLTRLEAQRVYTGLLPSFPNAQIVPDRIDIR